MCSVPPLQPVGVFSDFCNTCSRTCAQLFVGHLSLEYTHSPWSLLSLSADRTHTNTPHRFCIYLVDTDLIRYFWVIGYKLWDTILVQRAYRMHHRLEHAGH